MYMYMLFLIYNELIYNELYNYLYNYINYMIVFVILGINPYNNLLKSIKIGLNDYQYYDIGSFGIKYGKFFTYHSFYIQQINLYVYLISAIQIDCHFPFEFS